MHPIVAHFQKHAFFQFHLVKPRKTKLGDYRYFPSTDEHVITVNGDLKDDAFLFTALHEIAHQHTRIRHGNRVKPHGEEWKSIYRELLIFALNHNAFSNTQLILEAAHNLKSSSTYNPELYKTLYQNKKEGEIHLSDLENGMEFRLNQVKYRKIKKNRSRTLCLNLQNNKEYTISNVALVILD